MQAFEELVRKVLDTPALLASLAADTPEKKGNVDVSKSSGALGASACAC